MWSFYVTIGAVFIAVLVASSDATCSETNPCLEGLGQGQPFREPDQIDTTRHRHITLHVNIAEVQYGWLKIKRRLYNGKITGPTWNVKKGQRIILTVKNHLSPLGNNPPVRENLMNKPNTTNMHTHGLHISSDSPQDNVGIRIEPGQNYVYRYHLHEKQPSGTCWYHAHVHGSTMFQVQSGLVGLLVVKDKPWTLEKSLRKASCPYRCKADLQMIFQGVLQYSNTFTSFGSLQAEIGDDPIFRQDHIKLTGQNKTLSQWLAQNVNLMTVNGLLQPLLTLKEGKMYRFRMCNAAGFDTIEPLITKKGTNQSAAGCEVREIAYDGIYFNKPKKLHQGQSFMAPGNRVDWMVKCVIPGEYELRSYADPKNILSTGEIDRWNGLLLSITVKRRHRHRHRSSILEEELEGVEREKNSDWNFFKWWSPRWYFRQQHGYRKRSHYHEYRKRRSYRHDEFNIRLPKRPSFVRDLRHVREKHIKERFVFEFNTELQLNREHWTTPDNFRYAMTLNKIQEWYITNTDNINSHPFHPHMNSFQIISYNKYTGPFSIRFSDDYVLYNQDNNKPCHYQRAGLRTVTEEPVPSDALRFLGHDERYRRNAGNTLGYVRVGEWRDTLLVPPLANITIRFIPERYTGFCIIHCHLLAHEDGGMMMVTKIVQRGQSLAANITSGTAYPGTCRTCDRYPPNNPKRLCDLRNSERLRVSHNTVRNKERSFAVKSVRARGRGK